MAKVIGPALASIGALTISGLTYKDEHAGGIAASEEARRADAQAVTFSLRPGRTLSDAELTITNLSAAAIYAVTVDRAATGMAPTTKLLARMAVQGPQLSVRLPPVLLGAIPACSAERMTIFRPVSRPGKVKRGVLESLNTGVVGWQLRDLSGAVTGIEFKDASGIWWKRTSTVLSRSAPASGQNNVPIRYGSAGLVGSTTTAMASDIAPGVQIIRMSGCQ